MMFYNTSRTNEVETIETHWYSAVFTTCLWLDPLLNHFTTQIPKTLGCCVKPANNPITWSGCGSGVEPASCHQKVAGLIPLFCMLKGKILNSKLLLVGTLHGRHHHQCMNVCMNYCKSLYTKASDKYLKCKFANELCPCPFHTQSQYCHLSLVYLWKVRCLKPVFN